MCVCASGDYRGVDEVSNAQAEDDLHGVVPVRPLHLDRIRSVNVPRLWVQCDNMPRRLDNTNVSTARACVSMGVDRG